MQPRIYSNTNRIKFTDIPEKYSIPRQFRAKQSEVHAAVVIYVFEHYKNTKKYRQQVVDALNRLTYCVIQNELPSFQWASNNPIETMPDIDMDLVEQGIQGFFLTPDAIIWDVTPRDDVVDSEPASVKAVKKAPKPVEISNSSASSIKNAPLRQVTESRKQANTGEIRPTLKEDLYIQPPWWPRFDVNKVWMSATVGRDNLVIYTTIPEVPTKQNEVSITTDIGKMTDAELMALYPNHFIQTRASQLYNRYPGIDYDKELGCIFPIEGFTREQIVDNIIKYPHLYRLRKVVNGKLQPFFNTMEVDGDLVPTSEIWDTLPDSKIIPRNSEFVKEYIIRKYLLERDSGIPHEYDIFGTLEPFLTLFMPHTKYIERGYSDTLSIVKQCVVSRIHYKQSRSPILRRIQESV